jgi:integrase
MSRTRGSGGLFRQKTSSIWWIKYYKDGKPHRESTGTSNKTKAGRKLEKRLAEINTGTFVEPEIDRITIENLSEDFLRDYKINGKSSYPDAESRWRLHLQPFFGSLRIKQVTSVLLNKYVDKRQEDGAANGTINRELAALKRMFNLGRAATPPTVLFVPHFPSLAEDNVRQGFLEDDQFERLLGTCPDLWFQAIVEVGATYGWRIGELLKLRVNQVNIANRTIRLHPGTTKNKKGREVKMTEAVYVLLEQCVKGKEPDDFVFTWPDGRGVKDFRGTWEKAREAAGVPNLLFHDLRRTAARNLRNAGVAEGVIMQIGGWKTRSVFERYAIVSHGDTEVALDKLETEREAKRQARNKAEPPVPQPVKLFVVSRRGA